MQSDQGALKMSASACELEEAQRQARFLKFWKIAVKQLGPELFIVDCASVDDATDHNQLCPDFKAIEKHLADQINHHHYFLYVVASFYSETLITALFATAGIGSPTIIDLQFLTEAERMIVFSLIENYDVEW